MIIVLIVSLSCIIHKIYKVHTNKPMVSNLSVLYHQGQTNQDIYLRLSENGRVELYYGALFYLDGCRKFKMSPGEIPPLFYALKVKYIPRQEMDNLIEDIQRQSDIKKSKTFKWDDYTLDYEAHIKVFCDNSYIDILKEDSSFYDKYKAIFDYTPKSWDNKYLKSFDEYGKIVPAGR